MIRIGIIIGSTRPGRKAEAVARWVHEIAKKRSDAEFELVDIKDFNLPLLDEPMPPAMGQYSQAHTQAWAAKIASFDAYVFVTPEYNHATSGALKNAIDYLYREWNNKAAGFVSYGSAGGTRAVESLRLIMGELQVADVRAQVALSLYTDFENFTTFKPSAHHEKSVNAHARPGRRLGRRPEGLARQVRRGVGVRPAQGLAPRRALLAAAPLIARLQPESRQYGNVRRLRSFDARKPRLLGRMRSGHSGMRILAASDIHGDHETYHWIVTVAREREVELVVLAGDLLGYADGFEALEEAQRADAARVVSILRTLSLPIYYIMGNDDSVELQAPAKGFLSLHRRRIDHPDFNFVGYQCSLPFMGGVNERPEEMIAAELAPLEPLMDERTVFVTHSPAAGVLDSTLLGPAGSTSIRAVVARRGVRAHIHGHIHESFGREGRHFNVAAGHDRRAVLIDLNSMAHEVVEDAPH